MLQDVEEIYAADPEGLDKQLFHATAFSLIYAADPEGLMIVSR